MAWEIERRFLVRVTDALWCTLGDGHHYRQGYIRNGEPSVRIRTGEPRGAVLTCKIGSAAFPGCIFHLSTFCLTVRFQASGRPLDGEPSYRPAFY